MATLMIVRTARQRCRRLASGIVWLVVLGTVLLAGVVAAPAVRAEPAEAPPISCTLGSYLISLSRVDTAAGSFDADFWMWAICPDEKTEPLNSIEFVNGTKVNADLYSNIQKGKVWWSTKKFSGSFRQDFSMSNYPFDKQVVRIGMEEGVLDTRALTYTADEAGSKVEPALELKTWKVDSFRVLAGEVTHPTTYGDPTLAGASSTYANFAIEVGLVRRSHVADFLKATFAVYVAGLLALVSLLITDGRVGLLGATMFTVVLSFVSLDRILGPHDSLYLLDKVHFATLGVIMAAGALGVRSTRSISMGADKTVVHRSDMRAAGALLVVYLVTNAILVISAILG